MAGPHDRLLLGPWDHGARTNVSPWRARVAPAFPLLAEVLRFFDEHLLGLPHRPGRRGTGALPQHPRRPLARRRRVATGAGAAGVPGTRWRGLQRAPRPPHRQRCTRCASTPPRASHTRWERLGAANIEHYYDDWQGRDERLLNFTTAPYEHDVELSGHAVAHLQVASSERDAALYVYLSEVEADGRTHFITEGMLRALHRAVWAKRRRRTAPPGPGALHARRGEAA